MQKKMVIALSALPPCRNVLWIHSERVNFVAKVWRSALKNKIDEASFTIHSWHEYGNISIIFFNNNLFDDKQYDFGSDNEESEDVKED